MLQIKQIESSTGKLQFAQGPPAGPPLILLHGVLRCWQDYAPLIPTLGWRRQVFVLDFRGHGGSQRAPGRYLVKDYVDDVLAVLENACSAPAVIYGHSLGAMVAAAVAARAPEKAQALVLEDPPLHTMGARIRETPFHRYFCGVQQVVQQGGSVDEIAAALAQLVVSPADAEKTVRLADVRDAAAIRFSAKCLTQVDPDVLAPIVDARWLDGYDCDAIAVQITQPALLLQGDTTAGGMLTDADAKRMESQLAKCTRIRLPGAGHLLHWEKTEAVLRLTMGFLESL